MVSPFLVITSTTSLLSAQPNPFKLVESNKEFNPFKDH